MFQGFFVFAVRAWAAVAGGLLTGLPNCCHFTMIDINESIFDELTMATLTVRSVPDEVHRALRLRAAMNGHSTEAEVREILETAVKTEQRIRLGDALAQIGQKAGLTNEDFEVLERARDKVPAAPMRLE
jgi:plasmid stability protein